MRYLEIGIETQRAGIELILSALMKLGITDAVVEDPADIDDLLQKEKGYEWDYIDDSVLELKNETPRVTVYLNDDAAGRQQAEAICAAMRVLKAQAAGESVFQTSQGQQDHRCQADMGGIRSTGG